MKKILIASLALCSLGASAQEDLSSKKQEMNSMLDQKAQQMEEARNCVSEAGTKEELKTCKYEMKKEMYDQKAQRMEEKLEKIKSGNESDHSAE